MITIESIIKKLGFDPRKDDDYDWWKNWMGILATTANLTLSVC